MIPNLPPHLQEKMEEVYTKMNKMLWPQDSPASMRLRERQHVANEMYSLILQELGPVVEDLEQVKYSEDSYGCKYYAKLALKHLKERILTQERTGG